MTQTTLTVDVHLQPQDLVREMHDDVRRGLTSSPKALPPKWFYDEQGSRLFDAITRLPEYYPTRREREILARHSQEIAQACGADVLVELGSGTSEKTRLLLDALAEAGTLRRFVPLDVSAEILRDAADAICTGCDVDVHAVVGDFERHLHVLPSEGRRLVAFLGGTIGNLVPQARARFLSAVADLLGPDDALLLGCDLVKDIGRLEAAYNDRAGVTAAFNRNLLRRLNRELGADFDPNRFEHVAFFDRDREWIEMHLRSTIDQRVHVAALSLDVRFAAGEMMRTEVSAKFRREGIERELARAGLEAAHWWTDAQDDFALSLSTLP